MFANETLVAFFFKFFNFGLLIGLLTYYFKNYILPFIKQQMEQKEAALHALQERKAKLQQEQEELLSRSAQEAVYRKSLLTKVERWKSASIQQNMQFQQEHDRIHASLLKKIELQEYNVGKLKTIQKIFPSIINSVRSDMEKKFSHENEGQQFMNSIIFQLERPL